MVESRNVSPTLTIVKIKSPASTMDSSRRTRDQASLGSGVLGLNVTGCGE